MFANAARFCAHHMLTLLHECKSPGKMHTEGVRRIDFLRQGVLLSVIPITTPNCPKNSPSPLAHTHMSMLHATCMRLLWGRQTVSCRESPYTSILMLCLVHYIYIYAMVLGSIISACVALNAIEQHCVRSSSLPRCHSHCADGTFLRVSAVAACDLFILVRHRSCILH
jgi:hypothetical protein